MDAETVTGTVPKVDPVKVKYPKITFDVPVTSDTLNEKGEVTKEGSVPVTIELIQQAVKDGAQAIILELNTPGGEVDAGFKLGKAIEEAGVPVHCIVDGQADSMGFYLLQSCTTRTMTDRSALMAHGPAITVREFRGHEIDFRNIAENLRVTSISMNKHMCHRLKLSCSEFTRRAGSSKDWWMTSEEALKAGAVDKVVPDIATMVTALRTAGSWLGK